MNNRQEILSDEHALDEEHKVENNYVVPGLERGLRLLCEFTRHKKQLSAPELAKRLAIPRSTVFRLLTTLEKSGFIEKKMGSQQCILFFHELINSRLKRLSATGR